MKFLVSSYLLIVSCLAYFMMQDKELKESMQRGKEIYTDFCITCHLANGEGVENTFPPLAKSDYLINNRESSIKGVKYGQRGPLVVNGVTYDNTMMPLGLENEEIVDVMNYVLNSWGNSGAEMVTLEEVNTILK
ncbi:cytochrome c [uncultured Eudoraea sp.]|uniref:c-type cytochrome n=1 Tax=uncultured Eudoraea sp. TaxID=1035614 RepID=UPI00262AA40C|nr:cytochrome c [uncultured Eudoraea sp.]